MLALCPPAGVGDQDAELELAAIEGFFDGWAVDGLKLTKKLSQDGRTFRIVVSPSPMPARWLWELFEEVLGEDGCLVLEGFAASEDAAQELCLLALVVVLSDDRAHPLTEQRADYYVYAD